MIRFGIDPLVETGSGPHELPMLELGLVDPTTSSIGGHVAIGQDASTDRDQSLEEPTRSWRWLTHTVEQVGTRHIGERIAPGGITPVDYHRRVPVGDEAEVAEREHVEASAVTKLADEGLVVCVWKRPVATGASRPLGLYRANSKVAGSLGWGCRSSAASGAASPPG